MKRGKSVQKGRDRKTRGKGGKGTSRWMPDQCVRESKSIYMRQADAFLHGSNAKDCGRGQRRGVTLVEVMIESEWT